MCTSENLAQEKWSSPRSLQYGETMRDNIEFLFVFSGCDILFAIFNQGKIKFSKVLKISWSLMISKLCKFWGGPNYHNEEAFFKFVSCEC